MEIDEQGRRLIEKRGKVEGNYICRTKIIGRSQGNQDSYYFVQLPDDEEGRWERASLSNK